MLSNLMDFAKHIGRKVFDTDAEAADEVLRYLQSDNPGVDTLRVAYDDGVVTLTGRAADAAAKEKIVLMAGNVEGVERVDADGVSVIEAVAQQAGSSESEDSPAAALPPAAEEATQFYVIQSGDTLYKIASDFYGNGMKYPALFEANREVIQDPDKIYPGQKIRIPPLP